MRMSIIQPDNTFLGHIDEDIDKDNNAQSLIKLDEDFDI